MYGGSGFERICVLLLRHRFHEQREGVLQLAVEDVLVPVLDGQKGEVAYPASGRFEALLLVALKVGSLVNDPTTEQLCFRNTMLQTDTKTAYVLGRVLV